MNNKRLLLLFNKNTTSPFILPGLSFNSSLENVPYVISNALPTNSNHSKRWDELMTKLLPGWLADDDLNVIVGPVYDNNTDSIVDVLENIE